MPIVQRTLNFLDLPIPEAHLWEAFKEELKTLAVEILARLIVQATVKSLEEETKDHDR